MELWVKNQKKDLLIKVDNIEIIQGDLVTHTNNGYRTLGEYSDKRALEILDEIQKLISNDLIVFSNIDVSLEERKAIEGCVKPTKTLFSYFYGNNEPKIMPINRDSIVYEMPLE